ncbi:MAG TPA: cytochrome P450 [Actinocatenispora sp.]
MTVGRARFLGRLVADSVRAGGPSPVHALARFSAANGGIARLPFPGRFWVVSNPELLNEVLVTGGPAYGKNGRAFEVLRRTFGNGVFTAMDGPAWSKARQLMNPAFARGNLDGVVAEAAAATRQRADAWASDQPVAAFEEFKRINLSVLFRYLFGDSVTDEQVDTLAKLSRPVFSGMADQVFRGMVLPQGAPGGGTYQRAIATLDREVYASIERRRARGEHDRGDLLGVLIAAGLTDTELRDQVITLVLAGYDSTATLLSMWCLLLATRPGELALLRDEVATQLGGRTPTLGDLGRLEHCTAWMTAVLHDHPSFPIFFRGTMRDVTLGGHDIPADSQILVFPYAAHRDPTHWPGYAFDPTRFAERLAPERRRAHLPFGAGKRMCIGATMAQATALTVMAVLLQTFTSWSRPDGPDRMTYAMTWWPADGTLLVPHRAGANHRAAYARG